MKKALVVGIDHYQNFDSLWGCVNDAISVQDALERNDDGSLNFDIRLRTSREDDPITRTSLKRDVKELFSGDPNVALLYFAGHGHVEDGGGYICASDADEGAPGLVLSEVMHWAAESKAANKIIVLDSCFSGIAGNRPGVDQAAEISDGMTVLTAATEHQPAAEFGGRGIFTSLFVDALSGAAANLQGKISPGAVYAHIDQSLAEWGQRPVFKTNIKRFVSLKNVKPPIEPRELRQLATFFPTATHQIALDPSFEPERNSEQLADPNFPPPNPNNNETFRILQNYVKVNLVHAIGAPHMYHAAITRKSCGLTTLGKHYRQLVADGRI